MLAEESFHARYRGLLPGLLRYVSARVRDAHAADDLVQEVYSKAFLHRGDYDESRPFATWIYAIARNACIDHLRRRLRDPLSPVAPHAPCDLDTLKDEAARDPAEVAERSDLLAVVRRELGRLPDRRRMALEMKVLEGLTYREISEALGVPLGTAAFWVRESIEQIAKRLQP